MSVFPSTQNNWFYLANSHLISDIVLTNIQYICQNLC